MSARTKIAALRADPAARERLFRAVVVLPAWPLAWYQDWVVDPALRVADQLGRPARLLRWIAAHLDPRPALRGTPGQFAPRPPLAWQCPFCDASNEVPRNLCEGCGRGVPRTDEDVIKALVRIGQASRWERLEAIRLMPGLIGGYCVDDNGREHDTDARGPGCPAPVRQVAGLLSATGWQRLEYVGPWPRRPGGYCERPDGTGLTISTVMEGGGQ